MVVINIADCILTSLRILNLENLKHVIAVAQSIQKLIYRFYMISDSSHFSWISSVQFFIQADTTVAFHKGNHDAFLLHPSQVTGHDHSVIFFTLFKSVNL